MKEISSTDLINALRGFNLLPAIIFRGARKLCDESAKEVALKKTASDPAKVNLRRAIFEEFAEVHPEIREHKHKNLVIRAGIAAHHAGHIPAWKLLIEKMMSAGLLDAIFATSTVAAGVDFPARTVVIGNADARGNDGWRPLTASELQQMTGRAGRRGKDNVGFCILVPGRFQNPRRIATLLRSQPNPLLSQFRATYTSLLNLLDAYGNFEHVRAIAEKSFAFRETVQHANELQKRREKIIESINEKCADISVVQLGITFETVRAFHLLNGVKSRFEENSPASRAEMRASWLRENVVAGRIITQGRSGRRFLLVLSVFGDKVSAMREDGSGASLPLSRVNRVYVKKYPLKERSVEEAFYEIHEGKNPSIDEPKLSSLKGENDEAISIIANLQDAILPSQLSAEQKNQASSLIWNCASDADALQKLERDIDFLHEEIWTPFERRARVLDHFGYLDFQKQKVSDTGKWLADLRVDRPLLIGEALKTNLLTRLKTSHVAALMAALAADSDRNYGELRLSENILDVLTNFEDIVFKVSGIEWKFGVEPQPEMNLSAAATAESWAKGTDWKKLVEETGAEEGDLIRLLSRTGEALLQIASLGKSQPEAARVARDAAEIILREPVR